MTVTNTSTHDISGNVQQLIGMIQKGQIVEAIERFYAEDCAMQENANEPVRGRQANIEREKQFLEQVKTWNGFDAKAVAVDGDVAFIECVLDFVSTDDQRITMEQVSVQRWQDGKIVHERFYYDASAK